MIVPCRCAGHAPEDNSCLCTHHDKRNSCKWTWVCATAYEAEGHECWTAKGGNVNPAKATNYDHKETHRRRLVRRGRVGVHHDGAQPTERYAALCLVAAMIRLEIADLGKRRSYLKQRCMLRDYRHSDSSLPSNNGLEILSKLRPKPAAERLVVKGRH
jgi:hypothetical protein